MSELNKLITISNHAISNDSTEPTVNARELHAFLEVKTRFNDWINNRIKEYGFTQDVDFNTTENLVASETKTYGQGRIDYFITLDMAKELSMVERNAKGKEARRYFIACEKELKEQQQQPKSRYNLAFIERAMINRAAIEYGYFSVIDVVSDKIICGLEQMGAVFPSDKFCPDISVGILWAKYLKSTGRSPELVGAIKYKHRYPKPNPRVVDAWAYPNEMYAEFLEWLRSDWMSNHMYRYFSGKDKELMLLADKAIKTGWLPKPTFYLN